MSVSSGRAASLLYMARIPMLGAPTASGKSSIALQLAREFPLEIVTADAMQVYRGMDIGTAKPTAEERAMVPHHLIDLVTPAEDFSVAQWVRAAEAVIGEIRARGAIPLVTGGTGFYLRALSQGLPLVPPADPSVQAVIEAELAESGLELLRAELRAAAPVDAERAGQNPRRVVRALEILRRTGRPPSDFGRSQPAWEYDKLVLLPNPAELAPRIAERASSMFRLGLLQEVRSLLSAWPGAGTALQAIGYKEVAAHLRGEVTLAEAQEAVRLATQQYAKRQLTWFRREPEARQLPGLAAANYDHLRKWLAALA